MEIERHDAVGAGMGDQVGDELGGDRRARAGFAVLPRIAEIGNNRGDPARRCAAQRVGDDQQFHQMVVGGKRRRLDHEHIRAADVFLDLDENLHVGETPDHRFGHRGLQIFADLAREHGIGIAGDEPDRSVFGHRPVHRSFLRRRRKPDRKHNPKARPAGVITSRPPVPQQGKPQRDPLSGGFSVSQPGMSYRPGAAKATLSSLTRPAEAGRRRGSGTVASSGASACTDGLSGAEPGRSGTGGKCPATRGGNRLGRGRTQPSYCDRRRRSGPARPQAQARPTPGIGNRPRAAPCPARATRLSTSSLAASQASRPAGPAISSPDRRKLRFCSAS